MSERATTIDVERFVTLEANVAFIVRSLADSLTNWNSSGQKIDNIDGKVTQIEKDVLVLKTKKETEERLTGRRWERLYSPIVVFMFGLLSGLILLAAQQYLNK